MLHEFLSANRSELIRRCRGKVAARGAPRVTPDDLEHGVPLFLDQVTAMLGANAAGGTAESRMENGATRHGEELRRHRYTIEQVVHDYGDLCQAITELANEQEVRVTLHEFGALSIRLDNAIASAVTAALDDSLLDMRAVIDRTLAECGRVR